MHELKDDKISYLDEIVDENYCDRVIEYTDTLRLEQSRVMGHQISDYRKADVTWLRDKNCKYLQDWDKIVENISGIPSCYYEWPHIVKYEVGGEYKDHCDFFNPGQDHYDHCMYVGQRTHTFILYLNDNFTGGETYFPKHGLQIKPKKGSICFWRNANEILHESDRLIHTSLHAGLPVISGTKYILITWIRDKIFRGFDFE